MRIDQRFVRKLFLDLQLEKDISDSTKEQSLVNQAQRWEAIKIVM